MKKIILMLMLIPFLGVAQEKVDNDLSVKISGIFYSHSIDKNPIKGIEEAILIHLGVEIDSPNRIIIISNFFNQNNEKLICGNNSDEKIRDNEHIFKRSVIRGEFFYLVHIAQNKEYEIDFNFYEVVDGKKETIIDYIEKIINDKDLSEDFEDIDDLKELVESIEESGGKRGKDIK